VPHPKGDILPNDHPSYRKDGKSAVWFF